MFPVSLNRTKTEIYREGEIPHYKYFELPYNLDLLYTPNWTGASEPLLNLDTCKIPYSITASRIFLSTVDWLTVASYSVVFHINGGHNIQVIIGRSSATLHNVFISVDGTIFHNQNEPLQAIGNGRFEINFKAIGYTIQVGSINYNSLTHLWTGATELSYRRGFTPTDGKTLIENGVFDTWFNAGINQCNSELQIETNEKINFLRMVGDKKEYSMFNKEFYQELVKQTIQNDNPRLVPTVLCLEGQRDFKQENKLFVGYVSSIHSDGTPKVHLYSCGQIIAEMTDKVPTQPPCVIEKVETDTEDGNFCRIQLIGFLVDNAQYND